MIRYRTRPGVVLTEICGEHILVSARAIVRDCPFVTQINESSAFLWEKLRDGASEDELMTAVEKEFELEDPIALREAIGGFIRELLDLKLLITEQ